MEWYDRITALGAKRRLAARRMLLRTSAFLNQRLDFDANTLYSPGPSRRIFAHDSIRFSGLWTAVLSGARLYEYNGIY
jgi:hypothetical protein